MNIGYIEIIAEKYPTVSCHALGDGSDYNTLIHDGGDPIPAKATLDAELEGVKAGIMWMKIKAYRDEKLDSGFLCQGKWWHSDSSSRIKYVGLMMYGANMPTGINWKTMDGTFVEMTPTLIGQIFQALATWDTQTFTNAEVHKATMIQAADKFAYNYSTGWPAIYTGV